jgi:hypothetical protein
MYEPRGVRETDGRGASDTVRRFTARCGVNNIIIRDFRSNDHRPPPSRPDV